MAARVNHRCELRPFLWGLSTPSAAGCHFLYVNAAFTFESDSLLTLCVTRFTGDARTLMRNRWGRPRSTSILHFLPAPEEGSKVINCRCSGEMSLSKATLHASYPIEPPRGGTKNASKSPTEKQTRNCASCTDREDDSILIGDAPVLLQNNLHENAASWELNRKETSDCARRERAKLHLIFAAKYLKWKSRDAPGPVANFQCDAKREHREILVRWIGSLYSQHQRYEF